MAKSPKKAVTKKAGGSPLKISTSLFQRNSRNSTGSRSTGMNSTPAKKAAAAKQAAASAKESKSTSKAEKSKVTSKKTPQSTTKKTPAKCSTNSSGSSSKTTKNEPKAESKSKQQSQHRTLSNASSASSSTSAAKSSTPKGKTVQKASASKGSAGTSKTPSKSGKSSEEVKVVKAKQVERTVSTASSTVSSRRTSNASPPPPAGGKSKARDASPPPAGGKSKGKDSSTKSVKLEPPTRSPSRSPSPRLRSSNSSSSHNKVHTRTRSQSGSSSFPASPVSSTSSSTRSSVLSSSSSSAPSSPAQRRAKKIVKKAKVTVKKKKKPPPPPPKSAKKGKKDDAKKKESSTKTSEKSKKVEPPPPRKKTRSSSGDSSKSLRTLGGMKRLVRPSSPTLKSTKKPDKNTVAKKITKKAIKVNKPKPKPKLKVRPKSKKRMASLNAKAILEASFSLEKEEKKAKATPSPKITKHSSTDTQTPSDSKKTDSNIPKEIADFKNLLTDVKIEIRSGPPPNYHKDKLPEKISGDRKRKSSSSEAKKQQQQQLEKEASSNRKSSPPRRSSDSKGSGNKVDKGAQSSDKTQRKSSPVPRKKTKVATAETSTSTPAWNWDPNLGVYPHHGMQPAGGMSYGVSYDTGYSLHRKESHVADSFGSKTPSSKSQGCQAKVQSDSPAVVGGRTVYQPAGPLIEPHKNQSSGGTQSGFQIPEIVRLPPDLKVTYQTHPPPPAATGTNLPPPAAPKKSSSKGSSSKSAILHQPYKTASSSNSNTSSSSTSTSSVSVGTQQRSTRSAAPAAAGSSEAFGGLQQHQQQQQQQPVTGGSGLASHTAMTAAAVAAMGGSGASPMYYPGFPGPHHSPFAPSKFPIVPPDSFRTPSPYPPSFLYAPSAAAQGPTAASNPQSFYMTPFYTPPITPTSAPVLGGANSAGQPRLLAPPPHHPHGTSPALATASAIYQSSHPHLQHHQLQPQSNSSYFVTPPAVAGALGAPTPSHHSVSSQSSPGHAGPFPPNQSSPPACPCPTDTTQQSYPQRSNTSCTNSNSTSSKQPKPPPQPMQQPLPQRQLRTTVVTPAAVVSAAAVAATPSDHPENLSTTVRTPPSPPRRRATKPNQAATAPTKSTAAVPEVPKTDAKAPKPVESTLVKSFSEQYSLPDDITITPIMVPHGTTVLPTAAATVVPPPPAVAATPIVPAKTAVAPKPVKPKDIVHVINPRSGATTTIAKHMSSASSTTTTGPNTVKTNNVSPVKPNNAVTVGKINPDLDVIVITPGRRPVTTATPTTAPVQRVSNVNIVQPEVRPSQETTEIPTPPPVKRKGIHECVDGLQKKKMREAEQAAAAAAVTAAVNGAADRRRKSASPTAARALPREQVFEMRNSTIVNEREAVVAASALVVPSNRSQIRLSPHKNGLKRGLGLKVPPGHHSLSRYSGSKPVMTRSTTANAKIKTRSSVKDGPVYTSRVVHHRSPSESDQHSKSNPSNNRHRLLRRRMPKRDAQRMANPLTISTNGRIRSNRSPYLASPSSASSSSSGGQVILRIPTVGHRLHHHSSNYHHHHQVSSGSDYHHHHNQSRSLLVPATALRQQQHYDYAPAMLPAGRQFLVGESSGKYKAQIAGSMAFSAMKKRAIVKPLSPNVMNGALHSMMALAARRQPRWSNGWRFEGEPFEAKVYLTNDDTPVIRRCYPAMKHDGGDVIQPRDCVLLKSGPRKTDLPFVAKVAALWENPVDGEMMFSLLWYYRPEHTELGRQPEDMPDEIFASKHRDCNSVATIEDRCFVLTLNEYCRYKKRLKQLEEGITAPVPLVPLMNSSQANINSAADIAMAVWCNLQQQGEQHQQQRRVPPPGKVSPDVVFFCRKVYDFRQKRMLKNPT